MLRRLGFAVPIVVPAAMVMLVGCATTPGSEALKQMSTIQGGAYRQSGAQSVELGCYGLRTSGPDNPMECTTVPKWSTVKVRTLPNYALTISGQQTIDLLAKAAAEKAGVTGEASIKYQQEFKEKVRVVTYVIEDRDAVRNDLTAMIKANSNVSEDLRPGRARIVTAVQKVYDHEFWKKNKLDVALEGKFEKTGTPASAEVKLKNSTGQEVTLRLGDGTTIAYAIDRFCWSELKEGELRRTTTDFPGPDSNACETGSTRIHPSWSWWYSVEEWFRGLFD